jgi:tellurite resistance protein TerA
MERAALDMQSGQNAPVSTAALTLTVTAEPQANAPSLDLSLFLLDAAGRIIGDDGFIFYGNSSAPNDGIELSPAELSARCEPARLREGVQRVIIALSIDADVAGIRSFAQFSGIRLQVAGGETDLAFAIQTSGMQESALILGELYLRNGVWKLRALGQGFAGGLAPLASHYGVEIADTPAPSPAPAKPPPTPAPAPAAPRRPPPRRPRARHRASTWRNASRSRWRSQHRASRRSTST